jgi:hypothetical protein
VAKYEYVVTTRCQSNIALDRADRDCNRDREKRP